MGIIEAVRFAGETLKVSAAIGGGVLILAVVCQVYVTVRRNRK